MSCLDISCIISTGADLLCESNVGGIEKAGIGNIGDIATFTVNNTSKKVTALAMKPTKQVYDIEHIGEMFNADIVKEIESASPITATLALPVKGLQQHNLLDQLAGGAKVFALLAIRTVQNDQTALRWFVVGDRYSYLKGGGSQNTGTAFGDMQGVTINLGGALKLHAKEVVTTGEGAVDVCALFEPAPSPPEEGGGS